MKTLDLIALILTAVGGINWGLVGAFDFNLVDTLLGDDTALTNIVYILVGLSALWILLSVLPKYLRTNDRVID